MNDVPALPADGVTTAVLRSIVPPLPAQPRTRIALVSCGVKAHFPWDVACAAHRSAIDFLHAQLGEQFEILHAPEPFEDPNAMLRFLDGQLGERRGVDAVVLFHATYTAGEIGSQLARWLIDHPAPLLSWSVPDKRGGRLEANSLCCQNFLLGMFRRMGVKYAWMHGPIDGSATRDVTRFARSARARSRFRHGRLLHVGGSRVTAFYDGETDELSVLKRFGTRFDRVGFEVAWAHGKKFAAADVKRLRDAICNSPLCGKVDLPDEQINNTLRFGLAIADLAATNGYIGCTVKSWPELFDHYGCAIDGAVSMLNDHGLCTAEEGEMNGLISSLAMHALSDGAAITTLMDLSSLDVQADRIGIWHCGASPTRMLKRGTKYEVRKHSILENADPATAVGMMVEFLLELGPVTVCRYGSPDASSAFAFEGTFVDAPLAFRGNYGELAPDTADARSIMGTILSLGLDHHWSLGYGRWRDDLRMLNHWLGVRDVEPIPHARAFGLSGGGRDVG